MTAVENSRTKALFQVNAPVLTEARTVRIAAIETTADGNADVSETDRAFIANAVGRALCARLSQRFDVVSMSEPAELTVRVAITDIGRSSAAASAISVVTGFMSPVPMTPRVPFGLGVFSAEAEATDVEDARAAALVWTRGADAFTTRARVSSIGDAYELSQNFAEDFSSLMINAENPLREVSLPKLPGRGRPPAPACSLYGTGGGAVGFLGGVLGAPPTWTERSRPPVE